MSPTHEQIIAEAWLRHNKVNDAIDSAEDYKPLEHFVIEVVREGWKPPEPVDPDLLAFREWGDGHLKQSLVGDFRRGDFDGSLMAQAYLAGARMARERAGAAASEARIKALEEALRAWVEKECDFMRRNNLGNPEVQPHVIWSRALLKEADQ